MPRIYRLIAALLVLVPLALAASAARAEKRIALVIGNAGYQAGALNTPANDAGLIAQTLQASGFDVVGARDLDQDSLRRALRDFLDKAGGAGTDTVAVVYVAGYGLQLEGENYFVPIDAKIARDTDVAVEAVRISDYTRPLAALKLKTSIVIVDAARANPFAKSGAPLASGLALVEPDAGVLIAFNAAPGTVAPEGQGPYGPYAQALAEMMREGGLPLPQVFERVRLRVNDITKGAEVTWHASHVDAPFLFFERAADAPPPAVAPEQTAAIRAKPIREVGAQQAYALALERDTLEGYGEFVDAYPDDAMAKRVRVIIAARREAITWRKTRAIDTAEAYWSYLRPIWVAPPPHLPRHGVRAAAHVRRSRLRLAAAASGGDRLHPPADTGFRRSVLRLRAAAAAADPVHCAATAGIPGRGRGSAAAASRPVRAAVSGLSAGSGLGGSAGLRGGAAGQQRDLQQHPQHRGGEQRHQYGERYQRRRPDQNDRATRAARGGGICGSGAPSRRSRPIAAAFGRAESGGAAKSACCGSDPAAGCCRQTTDPDADAGSSGTAGGKTAAGRERAAALARPEWPPRGRARLDTRSAGPARHAADGAKRQQARDAGIARGSHRRKARDIAETAVGCEADAIRAKARSNVAVAAAVGRGKAAARVRSTPVRRRLGLFDGKRNQNHGRPEARPGGAHRGAPHATARQQGDGDEQEQWTFGDRDNQRPRAVRTRPGDRRIAGGGARARILGTDLGQLAGR